MTKYAGELIDTGIDAIHVSIDGDEHTHNFVRQAEWAYSKTLEGMEAIIVERERRNRHRPLVHVSFTMTRHNKGLSLYKLCEELDRERVAGRSLYQVESDLGSYGQGRSL
ncbi:MAG: hypothetical protein M5R38_15365 [Candidatus Methylomirabilis sp.]|nr:hypothetical protein [Candidatus Methylomirabilis sp.]